MSKFNNKIDLVAIGLWITNAAAALAITYLFAVMVVTANAQQEAIARLKTDQLPYGFSSAYVLVEQAEKLAPAIETGERLTQILESSQQATREGFEKAWLRFRPLAAALQRANLCSLTLPDDDALFPRQVALEAVERCQLGPNASAEEIELLRRANAEQLLASKLLDAHRSKYAEFVATRGNHEANKKRWEQIKEEAVDEAKLRRGFSEINYLKSTRPLMGWIFSPLPPAILQIFLTFVSGMFGALLVTLILIVYPNAIDLKNRSNTAARTLLGGMIALCVYVVLLSGTAVLGTGSSNGAGTNYLAFCGIGILAGMFADRVAGWLSTQANILFRDKDGEAGDENAGEEAEAAHQQ